MRVPALKGPMLPLVSGIMILGLLWMGPLPSLSRTAFSAHMLLHLGVVSLAAPLLAFGLLGSALGERVFPPLLLGPLLASAFDLVVVWGWHVPALHEAAARQFPIFVIQQASFLFAGMALWTSAFRDASKSSIVGILAMLATFMHMSMLGILLTLAPRLIYDPDLCIGLFGWERLEDQRLGGLMMAALGGLPYLFGGTALAYRLLENRR